MYHETEKTSNVVVPKIRGMIIRFVNSLGVKMRNIKLEIEYDGKKFSGWQKQPNKPNIQGEIEKAIKEITGEEVDLIASRKNR